VLNGLTIERLDRRIDTGAQNHLSIYPFFNSAFPSKVSMENLEKVKKFMIFGGSFSATGTIR
jgi:hypothetical protein